MWLGVRQLGQEIAISVIAKGSDLVPGWPSATPTADIYRGTTRIVAGLKLPKIDSAVTGLFRRMVFLGSAYSAGRYTVVIRWKISTFQGVQVDRFEIVAGGDQDGAITSMFHYEMPQARFVVFGTDGGRLKRGKNPSI